MIAIKSIDLSLSRIQVKAFSRLANLKNSRTVNNLSTELIHYSAFILSKNYNFLIRKDKLSPAQISLPSVIGRRLTATEEERVYRVFIETAPHSKQRLRREMRLPRTGSVELGIDHLVRSGSSDCILLESDSTAAAGGAQTDTTDGTGAIEAIEAIEANR